MKLLAQVRNVLGLKRYSYRTEQKCTSPGSRASSVITASGIRIPWAEAPYLSDGWPDDILMFMQPAVRARAGPRQRISILPALPIATHFAARTPT